MTIDKQGDKMNTWLLKYKWKFYYVFWGGRLAWDIRYVSWLRADTPEVCKRCAALLFPYHLYAHLASALPPRRQYFISVEDVRDGSSECGN